MNARDLHYTYDRGLLLFKIIFLYTYVNDYIWMLFFYVYLLLFVFLSLKLYVYFLILQQQQNMYI